MAISHHPALYLLVHFFSLTFLGFGINAFLRPAHALSFFEFTLPGNAANRKMVESLMIAYGVRDIFMGAAMFATSVWGSDTALGWILVAGSLVAFVDGLVCYRNGKGKWNHWGYAPVLGAVGAVVLGALDWT